MSQAKEPSKSVIIDTSASPYAALSAVPISGVRLTDGFWAERHRRNRMATLPGQFEHLEATGRLDNFRRAAGDADGPFEGLYFNDSDVYKWVEAASWALARRDAETDDDKAVELAGLLETTIDLIAGAQEPNGYLNTYYMGERAPERWSNLRDMHELYCAGHLMQAAVAHHRATGERRLLAVACRFADLICDTIGPEPDRKPGVPGHPEIEMALVELARTTGERRYLEQAAYFVNARGEGLIGGRAYHQDHLLFRKLDRLAGHAVRAAYLAAGATDTYAETGDPALRETLDRLWTHMRTRQMYITGGLGGRHQGEAIGADWELPNARAYAETCAGIANVMWAWRMLQLDGDPAFADLMERALYNAVMPGLSLDGESYFYVNPLASDGVPEPGGEIYQRQPWFNCACCPPNLARTIATLPGLLYGVTEKTLWVHHYAASEAEVALPDGPTIKLIQRTRYPWDGQVVIDILSAGEFRVKVRVPSWCDDQEERYRPTVAINGGACPGEVKPGRYVEIERMWAVGDTICMQLPMPVRRVAAHPYMLENTGRIALMRGPVLYCLEAVDHPDIADLRDVTIPAGAQLLSHFRPDLLGGVQAIEGEALVAEVAPDWDQEPYRHAQPADGRKTPVRIQAVPYFAWANRKVGAMQVWLEQG